MYLKNLRHVTYLNNFYFIENKNCDINTLKLKVITSLILALPTFKASHEYLK